MIKFKVYSINNFHLYNTVLLIIVILLYIKSPEFIFLISGSLYPLTNFSHFPLAQLLAITILVSISVSAMNDLVHLARCPRGPSVCHKDMISFYFMAE